MKKRIMVSDILDVMLDHSIACDADSIRPREYKVDDDDILIIYKHMLQYIHANMEFCDEEQS